MVKFILYILVIPLVILSFDAVNLNGIFKKNRYMQSRFFYMILCFCMSYLFTNFLYDFLTALK